MHALILGDPHLGRSLQIGKVGVGAAINSRITDQLNLLDWTLDYAITNHVDHIIITGDIFEEPKPSPSIITMFISWLKRCQVNYVNIYIIRGNHDFLRSGSVYSSPLDIVSEMELENVFIYKDVDTAIIGTTAFTMAPYVDRKSLFCSTNEKALSLVRDSLIYELASIPNTYKKVLVGHLAIEGSIPVGDEIDDITNELFCPIDMFKDYDYVWMGHVHKPQVMKKKNPYIAHIGSMDISNFGETDHKKHIVIFNCIDGTWDIEYLPTRPLKKITISIPKDTVDTTEYVLNEIKKNNDYNKSIIKVDISLESRDLKSINKSVIEKYLSDNGAFNVTGISESKKVSLIKKSNSSTITTKMDVVDAIKTYAENHIEKDKRSSFIELGIELYNLYKSGIKE